MRGRGLADSTIRSTYTAMRGVLDTAVRDELLAVNPAAKVKRPTLAHVEARFLTIPELHALLTAADGSRYAPLLALLVHTGMRRGEARALR